MQPITTSISINPLVFFVSIGLLVVMVLFAWFMFGSKGNPR